MEKNRKFFPGASLRQAVGIIPRRASGDPARRLGNYGLEITILAEVVEGRWRPGIGDPSVMGWVTVAAYCLAAVVSFRAAWHEPRTDDHRAKQPATFWMVLCIVMIALGINKQLDLQSLLTQIGRDVIRSGGWYRERRELQVGFILAVTLVCITAVAAFFWFSRRTLHKRWLALVGVVFILGFVVIRAASFHHVDRLLGASIGGMKWNWVLELGGIAAVAASAIRISLSRANRPRRTEGSATYHYRVNPP
jgi:hypothetical protein